MSLPLPSPLVAATAAAIYTAAHRHVRHGHHRSSIADSTPDSPRCASSKFPSHDPTITGAAEVAAGETVILLHPPFPFSILLNSDGEGMSVK